MVEVTILTEEEHYIGYEIIGHSDYASHGYDIVCSAVSVIAQATLLGLNLVDERMIELNKEDGHMTVITSGIRDETNLLITILYETIKNIANQYPSNVRVLIERYNE